MSWSPRALIIGMNFWYYTFFVSFVLATLHEFITWRGFALDFQGNVRGEGLPNLSLSYNIRPRVLNSVVLRYFREHRIKAEPMSDILRERRGIPNKNDRSYYKC